MGKDPNMEKVSIPADVVVIGGGSGGFSAALAAARRGLDTVLVERDAMLGGTSVNAGVNCWEPGVDGGGTPYELYERMRRIPNATGIYRIRRHCYFKHGLDRLFPGSDQRLEPELSYADTLNGDREQNPGKIYAGVIFEPEAWHDCAVKMLEETGKCRILTGREAVRLEMTGQRISRVELSDGTVLEAKIWIDNSGVLAEMAGCTLYRGEDPHSLYGEPDAPENATGRSNGASLIFRVAPAGTRAVEPLPADCRWNGPFPVVVTTEYPNGDLNCNMLPTMTGEEFNKLDCRAAYDECRRRVLAYWHYLQSEWTDFRYFRLKSIFPRIGVRESFRVKCEYMLTEFDLMNRYCHPDIIARANHMVDRHGMKHTGKVVTDPYGIPYRTLLPQGTENLLLAGRMAGFSSLAASSCRLSRTMMHLGEAAGNAAADAIEQHISLREVKPEYKELKSWNAKEKRSL